ncbi:MAG: hypothetical protein AAF889_08015 [Cyanobacteria bacterium P01_D01_bin.73]
MAKIILGGFIDPIEPFTDPATGEDIGVPTDAPGLQVHASKLGVDQEDRWVAGAVFGQPDGAPANAPRVAGGAIAWKNAAGEYDSKTWDGTSLSEDPRTAKQPWGAFNPVWNDGGLIIGREIFAKESNVTIGTPTGDSSVHVDLPPGMVIVPQAIAGLSRHDFINGSPNNPQPQAPSRPGVAIARDDYDNSEYWVAANQIWLNENAGNPEDEPNVYPFHIIPYQDTNIILFDVFYPGQTVAQVQANSSRPQAEPLTRAPQVGDQLAIVVSHGYFYQPATPSFFSDAGRVDPLPAGTWEWWIYRVPATGEKTVEAVTEDPTENYGIRIEGTEGTSSNQTGTVHQLAWHFGQPIRADGTWQQTVTEERVGSISRPPNTSGPLGGDGNSPGGTGFPGWPTAADAAGADAGFWESKEITVPGFGYFWPVVRNFEIRWDEVGIVVNAPWKTSEYISEPSTTETVTYDSRQGNRPGWEVVDGITTEAEFYQGNQNWAGEPAKISPLYGFGSGFADYVLVGPSPPCWEENIGDVSGSSLEGWVPGTQSGQCTPWVRWVHGTPVMRTYQSKIRRRTGTPVSPPPNPNDFPDTPTSGVPGGGSPGSDPPNFGLPPGAFPDGDWDTVRTRETQYNINAIIGPTLRSLQNIREAEVTTTSHSAGWNGARSNSSISSGTPVGTYELEGRFVFPMMSRSPTNSSITTSEEALFIVRTLNRKVQSTPFTTPYPYDAQKVYYQRAGSAPVEITGDIEALFPTISWQDPGQYLWSRNASLQNGVLYLYPMPSEGSDYRDNNVTIPVQSYRVGDGSLAEAGESRRKVQSLDVPTAIVHDVSAT